MMQINLSKKHVIFLCSGLFLIVSCMLLSRIQCVEHSTFSAWSSQHSHHNSDFFFKSFFALGIGEFLLLFARRTVFRIFAVLLTAIKLISPWGFLWALNEVGSLIRDYYISCSFVGNVPNIVTALTTLLLVQHVIMLFVLPRERQLELEEKYEEYDEYKD